MKVKVTTVLLEIIFNLVLFHVMSYSAHCSDRKCNSVTCNAQLNSNQVCGTNLIIFGTIFNVRFLIWYFWSFQYIFEVFHWKLGFKTLVS